jgi:hypothetical protein
MLVQEILSSIDVVGLGLLLGGAVYESIVMAPNYKFDVPDSLKSIRSFMKAATPANYFRVFSPATMLTLIIIRQLPNWDSLPVRWWILGAFDGQVITDTITYSFHYPRNKLLFIDDLSSDNDKLKKLAIEWGRGNIVRVILLVLTTTSVVIGLISLA